MSMSLQELLKIPPYVKMETAALAPAPMNPSIQDLPAKRRGLSERAPFELWKPLTPAQAVTTPSKSLKRKRTEDVTKAYQAAKAHVDSVLENPTKRELRSVARKIVVQKKTLSELEKQKAALPKEQTKEKNTLEENIQKITTKISKLRSGITTDKMSRLSSERRVSPLKITGAAGIKREDESRHYYAKHPAVALIKLGYR